MQIGDSEAKVELDRLKRQLSGKDAQISSVENELFKLRRDYDDVKRAKADASYELGLEAAKLKKTDELLTAAQTEIKSYRVRLANADAALVAARAEAAENLRSAQRDTNRSEESGLAGAHALEQAQAGQAKLADRVKALERELAESKASGSAANLSQAQVPVRSGLPVAQSRLPMKGGRRRSSSTSTFSNTSFQPASGPASSAGPSTAEVDGLKQKLAKATRELLLAQNSQIAAERQLKREREEAVEKLDDVREELERAGWERKALEETLRSTTAGGAAGAEKDAFGPVERGKLVGQIGVLEGRLTAIQATVESKDDELKRLTAVSSAEITSLTTSVTTLTSDLANARAQADTLISELAAMTGTSSAAKADLTAARQAVDDQTARANALQEAMAKAEAAAADAEAAKRKLEVRVSNLEAELATAGDVTELKRDLEAQLASVQTTLAASEASLATARASAAELQDQLDASHAACMDAETEISRLETVDRERSVSASETAADRQAALNQVELERGALQSELDGLQDELRTAEEGHRRILEVERESAAETAALLAEASSKLAASEKAVSKLSAKLALKEEETKELARALMETPPAAEPTPSSLAADVDDAIRSPEEERKTVGSLRLTEEEAEGVKRMENAISRLRSERDGLRAEREDLQRSIRFSEAETLAAQEHVASLTQALADEQQEHAALRLISSDTLTLAESLQEQLDVARPAVVELEALRDELFRSLEASDAQLDEVKRAEQEAIAHGDSLKSQLCDLRTQTEAVETALAAALEAKEVAIKRVAEKETALAFAVEEKAVAEEKAASAASSLSAVTEERNVAAATAADKYAALEAALQAAIAATATATNAAVAPKAGARDISIQPKLPAASTAAIEVEALVKEKGVLEARIQRRNASVEKLQHDLAKLNTTHALLKDGFDDLEEELADLKAERATLSDQVAEHQSVQASLTADLESARASIQLLETAVSTASSAARASYDDDQVAALVGVLFAERAQRIDFSSKAVRPDEVSDVESLLATTASRLEATVEELSAARERSIALEAQLASEDRQLHALLDAATARLETVEAELSTAAGRSAVDTTSLLRANALLSSRLDTTTANLNARAIEVLVVRSSMRTLLAELEASNAGLESLDSEATMLRTREADHLSALENSDSALQSISKHLNDARDAHTQLTVDNAALQAQLEAAQADLHAETTAAFETDTEREAGDANGLAVIASLEAEVSHLTTLVAETSAALAEKDAAVTRALEDAALHSQDLAAESEAKIVLKLQISSLKLELDEVRLARDELAVDQTAFKDEIATLKSTLAAQTPAADRFVNDTTEVDARLEASEAKHTAAVALLQESEEAIATLQSQLAASEDALASLRAAPVESLVPETADTEAAHLSLIALHVETVAALAASRHSELALQEEAASRRAQLDDVLDGLSKLQQDHASILQAKSIAESHVAQIVASTEEAVRQLNEDHAKAVALLERAKAVKAEQAQDLEGELKAAKASLQEAITRSEAQDAQLEQQSENLDQLRQEVVMAKSAVDSGAAALAMAEETVRQLEVDKATAAAELDAIRQSLMEQTSVVQDRERLHAETMHKIDQLQMHIAAVETKLEAAELRLGRQKSRHDDEIAALEKSLAEASAASGSAAEGSVEERIADLEDHVERLIASLDQKNVEVEEADDKIISMLKEKKKFERKIELLQKKLEKATTAATPVAAPIAPSPALAMPVTRAPPSPLNPSATVFVSVSPARPAAAAAASAPAPVPAVTPRVVNMFAPSPAGPSHRPSPFVSSSLAGASSGFTPQSHRPIASSRRVSAEHASGPGTPRSRVASAPVVASPRQYAVFPSTVFGNENVPPPPPASSIGTKRSRPAELEQLGPSAVTAILAPAPSPGSVLSPASGNTPRRAVAQPLLTRKTDLKGFTPKRSADRRADLAAGVQSRLGSLTLGKEGLHQSSGGLKASSGDLMSRLAAMRR